MAHFCNIRSFRGPCTFSVADFWAETVYSNRKSAFQRYRNDVFHFSVITSHVDEGAERKNAGQAVEECFSGCRLSRLHCCAHLTPRQPVRVVYGGHGLTV